MGAGASAPANGRSTQVSLPCIAVKPLQLYTSGPQWPMAPSAWPTTACRRGALTTCHVWLQPLRSHARRLQPYTHWGAGLFAAIIRWVNELERGSLGLHPRIAAGARLAVYSKTS